MGQRAVHYLAKLKEATSMKEQEADIARLDPQGRRMRQHGIGALLPRPPPPKTQGPAGTNHMDPSVTVSVVRGCTLSRLLISMLCMRVRILREVPLSSKQASKQPLHMAVSRGGGRGALCSIYSRTPHTHTIKYHP